MTQKRRYNNYTLAIIASLSITFLIVSLWYLLGASLVEGLISQSMYDFLAGSVMVMLVAQAVAGSGYFATWIDILADEKTAREFFPSEDPLETPIDPKKKLNFIRWGELLGILVGLGLAIVLTLLLAIKKAGSLIFHKLPIIGPIIFLLANMGMLAGFFARIGRVVDYFRMKAVGGETFENNGKRNVNYILAVMAGIIIGIVLASVILGVAGVTSAMTFGGAIPVWAGGITAFLTILCATVSASNYFGRMCDFLFGLCNIFEPTKENDQTIGQRVTVERILTMIGIGVGIILATALVLSGIAVSSGLFGLGLPFWASTPLIYATFIAFCAGTAHRLGVFIDRLLGWAPASAATATAASSTEMEQQALLPQKIIDSPPIHALDDGRQLTTGIAPSAATTFKTSSNVSCFGRLMSTFGLYRSPAPENLNVNDEQLDVVRPDQSEQKQEQVFAL